MQDAGPTADLSHPELAEALFHALRPDAYYAKMEALVEPSLDAKLAMLRYYDHSITEAERFGRVNKTADKVSGVCIWSLPLDAKQARQKHVAKLSMINQDMGAACSAAYQKISTSMSKAASPFITGDDWYLSILGVAPAAQGQGLGGPLIAPILQSADDSGCASYLETFTPRNMSFYSRMGFEVAAELFEPLTAAPYWLMRRPAA